MSDTALAAALAYATWGYEVLPVHSVLDGSSCSCRHSDCASPGKHPRTAHGLRDATTNSDTIRAWFRRTPGAGLAVRTGRASGILCLDLDRGHQSGVDGVEALHRHGLALPSGALIEETPAGGLHVYFAYAKGERGPLRNFASPIRDRVRLHGVDGRGDGGYVVCAPTLGYRWVGPRLAEQALIEPPVWLVEVFTRRTDAGEAGPWGGAIDWAAMLGRPCEQGSRHTTATRLAGHLAATGVAEREAAAIVGNWNLAQCCPSLPSEEVIRLTRDICRKHRRIPLAHVEPADDATFAKWWLGLDEREQAALASLDPGRESSALVDAVRSGAPLELLLTLLVRMPRSLHVEGSAPRYSALEARTRLWWAYGRASGGRAPYGRGVL